MTKKQKFYKIYMFLSVFLTLLPSNPHLSFAALKKYFLNREMTTTDRYYIELAGELSSLLNKIFADLSLKTSIPTHFIPLADVYCFWNRARGTGTYWHSLRNFIFQ